MAWIGRKAAAEKAAKQTGLFKPGYKPGKISKTGAAQAVWKKIAEDATKPVAEGGLGMSKAVFKFARKEAILADWLRIKGANLPEEQKMALAKALTEAMQAEGLEAQKRIGEVIGRAGQQRRTPPEPPAQRRAPPMSPEEFMAQPPMQGTRYEKMVEKMRQRALGAEQARAAKDVEAFEEEKVRRLLANEELLSPAKRKQILDDMAAVGIDPLKISVEVEVEGKLRKRALTDEDRESVANTFRARRKELLDEADARGIDVRNKTLRQVKEEVNIKRQEFVEAQKAAMQREEEEKQRMTMDRGAREEQLKRRGMEVMRELEAEEAAARPAEQPHPVIRTAALMADMSTPLSTLHDIAKQYGIDIASIPHKGQLIDEIKKRAAGQPSALPAAAAVREEALRGRRPARLVGENEFNRIILSKNLDEIRDMAVRNTGVSVPSAKFALDRPALELELRKAFRSGRPIDVPGEEVVASEEAVERKQRGEAPKRAEPMSTRRDKMGELLDDLLTSSRGRKKPPEPAAPERNMGSMDMEAPEGLGKERARETPKPPEEQKKKGKEKPKGLDLDVVE
jgi:hypothetical protein